MVERREYKTSESVGSTPAADSNLNSNIKNYDIKINQSY